MNETMQEAVKQILSTIVEFPIIGVILSGVNIYNVMSICIAPKAYLLDYLIRLLGKVTS